MKTTSNFPTASELASHVKNLVGIFLSTLIIFSGILLLIGYGYLNGYSELFNYQVTWTDISTLNIHMLGLDIIASNLSVVIKAFIIAALLFSLFAYVIYMKINLLHKYNKPLPMLDKLRKKHPNIADLFEMIVDFILKFNVLPMACVCVIALYCTAKLCDNYGELQGVKSASKDLHGYRNYLLHNVSDVSYASNGVQIIVEKNNRAMKYIGFIINKDEKEFLVYAITDQDNDPAFYTIEREIIWQMKSYSADSKPGK